MQQPSNATATELFEGRKHYAIPAYQRPYVWNEEDQWAPLWDDIVRVSDSHLGVGKRAFPNHFLGAVVFEIVQASSAGITELAVIDGQQRLMTLQLLLSSIEGVLKSRGHKEYAERLEELILNKQATYRRTPQRFKLWPSQANRAEFAYTMDSCELPPSEPGQIQGAYNFFRGEATRWLSGEPDTDGAKPPGLEADRARELTETLAGRLVVVAIDLSGEDDAQLIFETLNDRGTPLLKADLIKNWVFRRGQKLQADVDKWSRTIWEDFDTDWWREEINQGRAIRSRVDIFLQYWLTMRLRDEVKQELVFRTFTEYAEPLMPNVDAAESFLTELRKDANSYRAFDSLTADTPAGRFRARVIEAMELAGTTPIFLWVVSQNHRLPQSQIEAGLAAIESWVVRRTLLRQTSKDMNKLIVALLKSLTDMPATEAGEAIRKFLSQQTADTRIWPSDAEFISSASKLKMYGSIKQGRIVVILSAIEAYKRRKDPKYGSVTLPARLTIEHVMPQGWRERWKSVPALTSSQEAERDKAVHTLGNLTLVTQSLNSSLSNRPWTDAESVDLSDGGNPGMGKRSVLDQFNLLVLNKEVLEQTVAWTEQNIADRGIELASTITRVWPGPDEALQLAAFAKRQGEIEVE
jgi:Protein of unknown function DUF262/Protein of unknown function (DUF1524)